MRIRLRREHGNTQFGLHSAYFSGRKLRWRQSREPLVLACESRRIVYICRCAAGVVRSTAGVRFGLPNALLSPRATCDRPILMMRKAICLSLGAG